MDFACCVGSPQLVGQTAGPAAVCVITDVEGFNHLEPCVANGTFRNKLAPKFRVVRHVTGRQARKLCRFFMERADSRPQRESFLVTELQNFRHGREGFASGSRPRLLVVVRWPVGWAQCHQRAENAPESVV